MLLNFFLNPSKLPFFFFFLYIYNIFIPSSKIYNSCFIILVKVRQAHSLKNQKVDHFLTFLSVQKKAKSFIGTHQISQWIVQCSWWTKTTITALQSVKYLDHISWAFPSSHTRLFVAMHVYVSLWNVGCGVRAHMDLLPAGCGTSQLRAPLTNSLSLIIMFVP